MRRRRLDGSTAEIAKLVQRARQGDAASFGSLIQRAEKAVLAVAFSACGDATLAGDVTQEAFLRAWTRLSELKEDARFVGWVCGIARHLALDAVRSEGRRRLMRIVLSGEAGDVAGGGAVGAGGARGGVDVPDPVSAIESMERSEQIAWALEKLDETSRTIIVLRYYDNQSSSAIAELLGATPAAVDMRLSRARKTMRDLLSGDACGGGTSSGETGGGGTSGAETCGQARRS